MSNIRTVKVSLAISSSLLKILDDLPRVDTETRSEIFRLAILQYTRKPGNESSSQVSQILSQEQERALRSYQRGEIEFRSLVRAGVDDGLQMELMKLGEL